MESIFEDITLQWDGKEYKVKADRVMPLLYLVEEHVTVEELMSRAPKRVKIAAAYAAALSYAGAKDVTHAAVYNSMFGKDTLANMANVINGLLMLLIPPEHLRRPTPEAPKAPEPGEVAPGKKNKGKPKKAPKNSTS